MDADRRVKVTKTDAEWKNELTLEQYRPRPAGARYCMNGVALKFTPDGTGKS